jgi:aryl-phospho-beta-D-glucosidase BglC (GH1 family)
MEETLVHNGSRLHRSSVVVLFALATALAMIVLPLGTQSSSATVTAAPLTAAAAAAAAATGAGSQQPGIAFESPAQMGKDLDAIVAAGMTWVRVDFFWSSIQAAGPTSFVWGPTDAFVKAAKARGLNILALVAYAPSWARSGASDYSPPKDPRDYANFVGVAARRYAPSGVHAWEIWNEPNLAMFWYPKADSAAYSALLKRAYPAIKAADPKAIVVSGGLAPALDTAKDRSPMTFLSDVYAHGGAGNFDAVGYHPYSFPYAPMFKADWNTFYRTPDFHAIMTKHGDGAKAVWGTEMGYPTGTSSRAVNEQRQADDLVAAVKQWKTWSFTGPLMLYTVRDSSSNKADVNANMGMYTAAGNPKPAFAALRRALR